MVEKGTHLDILEKGTTLEIVETETNLDFVFLKLPAHVNCRSGPHESNQTNRFRSQLFDYADKHAKGFVISLFKRLLRNQLLTFGVFPGQ